VTVHHRDEFARVMIVLRIGLVVLIILCVVAGAMVWGLLGRFVVAYAKMDADERVEENAPPPRADAARSSRPHGHSMPNSRPT
jgi:hypothetical protein